MGAGVQQDVATVRAIYDAFNRRDLAAIRPHVAPHAELHGGPTERIADTGHPYRGLDGLQRYFADVARVWTDLRARPEDYRATPGSVVVFGRLTGTHEGQRIDRRIVWTWRLEDGRVTSLSVSDVGGQAPAP